MFVRMNGLLTLLQQMFSWIGHIALTHLLPSAELFVLKVLLITLHCLASYISLDQFHIMSRIERR